jgi:hypothetical protein
MRDRWLRWVCAVRGHVWEDMEPVLYRRRRCKRCGDVFIERCPWGPYQWDDEWHNVSATVRQTMRWLKRSVPSK